jgi:hypothetical protein
MMGHGMNFDLQDPTILIPAGVLLIGIVLFIWGLGKLFKKTPPPEDSLYADLPPLNTEESFASTATPDVPEPVFTPPPRAEAPAKPAPGPAVPSKEMVDRLDNMSQRLNDMQGVLQKQASAAAGTALTAETIDKLLKIIGNVTQQVDLLQRSLGAPPASAGSIPPAAAAPAPVSAPKAAAPAAPASAATPVPISTPAPAASTPKPASTTAAPTLGAPNGKRLGVAGGALSSLPDKQTPPNPPGK